MASTKTQDERLTEWNNTVLKYLIPNDVVLSLYLILGTIGNITVILVYVFKMKVKRDDRFFIPVLASVDFIACLVGASFAFAWNIIPVKFNNGIVCEVLWFVSQGVTIISAVLLIIIAVQRYLKVCKPSFIFTQKMKYFCTILAFCFGFAFSVPIFFYYGSVEIYNPMLNVTGFWCGQKRQNIEHVIIFDISAVIVAVIASIVLIILYILIGKAIYRKFIIFQQSVKQGKYTKNQRSSVELESVLAVDKDNENESSRSRANSIEDLVECDTYRRKVKRGSADTLDQGRFFTIGQHFRTHRYSYMFMTITALFIIAYSPRVTLMLLESIDPNFWNKPNEAIAGFLFLYRMYLLNHAVNPFIYTFFDTRFRKAVSEIFCCCCATKKSMSL
ncbi:cholecystokinin receptor-like [Mytilus californianus]|uniref:cholecystokinin receptor-like n=1 Tax=Mytilus californianus TaxID=6549 RepID=UPI0022471361|nr:cholecystokinin receptor-like [Mytilus californianus]